MTTVPATLARLRGSDIGAFFRPGQLRSLGIDYDALRRLVRAGEVEAVARGLYRRADAEPTEHYSLAAAAARAPHAVFCLLSALRVHGIGTRVPAEVWLAIPHKARPPRIHATKIRVVRFTGPAWTYGIVPATFEGVPARITNPARTVVDCFRFERLIGREASMEALRDGLSQKRVTMDALVRTLEVLPSRRLRAALEAME